MICAKLGASDPVGDQGVCAMATVRLTTGQAIVRYLQNQYVEFDGERTQFFAGCWGIFGHGNIGGIAQGLQQAGPAFPYYLARNGQSMVHTAVGYAELSNRRSAFACLTSIGPGATNMVTGAITATVNRVPVLLLAGDSFAERVQDPVLQQMVSESAGDVSASDVFRPVVRYFDRISRPEQIIASLPEVMRVLTSPADTGAVMLTVPQDIQTYAFDFPEEMFHNHTWRIGRQRADVSHLAEAAEWIKTAKRPLVFAGGGARYSEATDAIRTFAENHGVPVAETHAGKGTHAYDHPLSLGGAGVAGTRDANLIAEEADLGEHLVESALAASRSTLSIDSPFSAGDDASGGLAEVLGQADDSGVYSTTMEDETLESGIHDAMDRLSDRERFVIEMRFGINREREHTLSEVAAELGVSLERVRQIQVRAISKMKTPLLRKAIDPFI